jgi:hypothetical protein
MLAVGDLDAAQSACRELDEIADRQGTDMLAAMAAHARGEVALAGGDTAAALVALRRACQAWQELGAPHEAARARVLLGLACRSLGDEDTTAFELDAAHGVFTELGADPAMPGLTPCPPGARLSTTRD